VGSFLAASPPRRQCSDPSRRQRSEAPEKGQPKLCLGSTTIAYLLAEKRMEEANGEMGYAHAQEAAL